MEEKKKYELVKMRDGQWSVWCVADELITGSLADCWAWIQAKEQGYIKD